MLCLENLEDLESCELKSIFSVCLMAHHNHGSQSWTYSVWNSHYPKQKLVMWTSFLESCKTRIYQDQIGRKVFNF